MTTHVVSLEVAEQLKESGWKKIGIVCWYNVYNQYLGKSEWSVGVCGQDEHNGFRNADILTTSPAPVATEILEELPVNIKGSVLEMYKFERKYGCGYRDNVDPMPSCIAFVTADTLPNALGLMWLYLKKEQLL